MASVGITWAWAPSGCPKQAIPFSRLTPHARYAKARNEKSYDAHAGTRAVNIDINDVSTLSSDPPSLLFLLIPSCDSRSSYPWLRYRGTHPISNLYIRME